MDLKAAGELFGPVSVFSDGMSPVEQIRQRVLILKCQIGDRLAWEELYRRYNPALGYYLRRLIGAGERAVDVQQEVWLAVLRHLPRLTSPEAFTVWFYRIARSKVLGASPTAHQPVALTEDPPAPADEGEEGFSAADAARVHAGLDHLSPDHRDVLLLRFMEDLSYQQIAQVIGCTVGTVRSRIHYAKAALKRQLEATHD